MVTTSPEGLLFPLQMRKGLEKGEVICQPVSGGPRRETPRADVLKPQATTKNPEPEVLGKQGGVKPKAIGDLG